MDKKSLREKMLAQRESLSGQEKESYDESIFNKIVNNEFYKKADTIFVYVSFRNEVDTHRLINYSLKCGKSVCVPKVINRQEGMKAYYIGSLQELKRSSYGILEPENTHKEANPEDIDVVFVPGLLFDKRGGRLGYGAGYYDKYLKLLSKDCQKIGIAYSLQIVQQVPMEEYDEFVDFLITE